MSQKEIKKLTELFQEKLKEGVSKEEALRTFVEAGILDENAKYTAPVKNLEFVASQNK
jgi:hypothetical protein